MSFTLAWVTIVGCTVGPDYEPPEPQLPDAWHQELVKGLASGNADLKSWWTALNDPVLTGLLERATPGNLDLQVALERIEESRALLGATRGVKYPLIDATGAAQRSRLSESTNPVIPPGLDRTDNFFSVGMAATWELDVFGRIRRLVESAEASHEATVEAYRDLLVLLYADVAATYVDVRSLQERVRFAQLNAELQQETMELTQVRFDTDIGSELDVRQAELNLSNTQAGIPALQQQLQQAIHRLGVLVGELPSSLIDELSAAQPIPAVPDSVTVGVPAELLRQRPDVRRAERLLASQTALIGVATAELFPRFTLNGTLALEASQLQPLFNGSSHSWSFGPAVRWNIFSAGRIRNKIRAEDSRARQALLAYEQTVLLALEEVENSMVAYVREIERGEALERSVTAASRSVELVDVLYRTGLTDFNNVLDTQRFLTDQQDRLADSRGQVVKNVIAIYRSFGGGWVEKAEEEEEGPEDEENS